MAIQVFLFVKEQPSESQAGADEKKRQWNVRAFLKAENGQGLRKEWFRKLSHDEYGIVDCERSKHVIVENPWTPV
jgi:hypothetical protein